MACSTSLFRSHTKGEIEIGVGVARAQPNGLQIMLTGGFVIPQFVVQISQIEMRQRIPGVRLRGAGVVILRLFHFAHSGRRLCQGSPARPRHPDWTQSLSGKPRPRPQRARRFPQAPDRAGTTVPGNALPGLRLRPPVWGGATNREGLQFFDSLRVEVEQ